MKNEFKQWLLRNDYKENTINSYSSGINIISKDLSEKMNANIDLYSMGDIFILAKISELYDITGNFSELGNQGNGTVRNAIRRYFDFIAENK